jgi:hypothetical protein
LQEALHNSAMNCHRCRRHLQKEREDSMSGRLQPVWTDSVGNVTQAAYIPILSLIRPTLTIAALALRLVEHLSALT